MICIRARAILCLLFIILTGSASVSAAPTSASLNGSFIECTPTCLNQGTFIGGSFTVVFTFDDALNGTTITNTAAISGMVSFDNLVGPIQTTYELTSINLDISADGAISGGAASGFSLLQTIAPFGGINILEIETLIDLSTMTSPLDTDAHAISNLTNFSSPIYLSAACFDGFDCNPIPLPTAGWLFASALVGFGGIKTKRRLSDRCGS